MLMLSNANSKQCEEIQVINNAIAPGSIQNGKVWVKVGRRRRRRTILAPRAAPPLARPAAKNWILNAIAK